MLFYARITLKRKNKLKIYIMKIKNLLVVVLVLLLIVSVDAQNHPIEAVPCLNTKVIDLDTIIDGQTITLGETDTVVMFISSANAYTETGIDVYIERSFPCIDEVTAHGSTKNMNISVGNSTEDTNFYDWLLEKISIPRWLLLATSIYLMLTSTHRFIEHIRNKKQKTNN